MENQTNQSSTSAQSLKDTVSQILNDATSDVIISCFFQEEGPEPCNGKFYHEGQEDTYNALQGGGINVKLKDGYSGDGEGKGDEYWTIYEFSNGNESVYVQFDGWYASYNGPEFNEWFFVEPNEVRVVKFYRCKQLQLTRSQEVKKITLK